jgi:hypothetical protein
MIRGEWERRKKRYLNLLLEKGKKNKKETKFVFGCVVNIGARR